MICANDFTCFKIVRRKATPPPRQETSPSSTSPLLTDSIRTNDGGELRELRDAHGNILGPNPPDTHQCILVINRTRMVNQDRSLSRSLGGIMPTANLGGSML